jgi:type I restriction enzyme R subunit
MYLSPEEALTLRRGESGTLLYPILRDKLISLNPGIVTVDNVDPIINRIESVRNNIEGNAEVLSWRRGRKGVWCGCVGTNKPPSNGASLLIEVLLRPPANF